MEPPQIIAYFASNLSFDLRKIYIPFSMPFHWFSHCQTKPQNGYPAIFPLILISADAMESIEKTIREIHVELNKM